MLKDIQEVLISEEELQSKVKELAAQISEDYAGKNLLLLCILKGGVMFMADLARNITIPAELDFMAVSSYGSSSESSGVVKIVKDLNDHIEGKHVLIVEDIIDSGLTLNYLVKYLKARGPESVEICTILDKPERREVDVEVKYKGFDVPNAFLVGYGLDYAEKYRNIPFIGILKEAVYQ